VHFKEPTLERDQGSDLDYCPMYAAACCPKAFSVLHLVDRNLIKMCSSHKPPQPVHTSRETSVVAYNGACDEKMPGSCAAVAAADDNKPVSFGCSVSTISPILRKRLSGRGPSDGTDEAIDFR
jgi:hypothetical protein